VVLKERLFKMSLRQDLKNFTKKKTKDESQVMCRIPAALKAEVDAMIKIDRSNGQRMSWKALIELACLKYLEEK
jgi:predicted lactoylglutathione lyase